MTKFKPYSTHLFSVVISKSDKSCKNQDEVNQLAELVRNDMEHLVQGFKVLNSQMTIGYLASTEMITFLDLMVYNEISQVLFFYHNFKENSRSNMYKKFVSSNSDWDE